MAATAPVQGKPPRSFWREHRLALVFLLAVLAAFSVDALFIEPNRLQVNHFTIRGHVSAPLTIAHLSDLHTSGIGRRERRVLSVLDAEKPDVIVVTGDSIASSHSAGYEPVRQFLSKLHAPLGVWVVRGNWENWVPLRRERAFYDSAGVHLLLNSGRALRPDIWLAGIDDPWSGNPDLQAALGGALPDAYKILLFHAPFYLDDMAGSADLVLAGHTHGGQVRIPGIRPFWLPGGCDPYLEGWYELKGTRMYVSRGIGMSDLPVRFLCRPELVFLTVTP